jgi:hypothetical protein
MRSAAAFGAALAILLGGCTGDRSEPEVAVVTEAYPVERFDLVATPEATLANPELRGLAQGLVDVEGVRLTEADYEARLVRILVEPGLGQTERARLKARLESWPGVAGVRSAS